MRLFLLSKRKGTGWNHDGWSSDWARLKAEFRELLNEGRAANAKGEPAKYDELILASTDGGLRKRGKFDGPATLAARKAAAEPAKVAAPEDRLEKRGKK